MAMTAFEIFGVLKLNSSDFDKGLDNSLSSAKRFGTALNSGLATAAKVGLAAVGTATAAIVGLGKTAVSAGSQFDTAMGSVAATLGQSMSDMEGQIGQTTVTVNGQVKEFSGTLREFAMFMGQNTVFSATEAAQALNYMALAGYDTQKSMSMLPAVLDMAAAGSMDLALASDMITDTQSALGLSFDRTNQMVDEFAKAASTGNTSVQQLGEAFLRVGGLAKELNGGMVRLSDGTTATVDGVQELEIAFTAMANAGVKGTEAGTHMRNMLLKLSDPTKDGAAALEAMGISVFDATGGMRSLSAIFGDLNAQFKTMSQEERIGIISDLFNTRDMASAEALLAAVESDWDAIGESILDAEGAASQMAATKLDNLAGDITLFKSALETAQIVMNDQLSPTLREFVKFGTSGLQKVTEAFQEGGLSGAMEAFGDVLSEGLKMVVEKVPDIINAAMQLLSAFGKGIMDNAPIIIDSLKLVVQNILKALVTKAKEGAPNSIMQIINMLLSVFTENASLFLGSGVFILKSMINGIIQTIPEFIKNIGNLLAQIGEIFIKNAPDIMKAGQKLIVFIINGITNQIPALIPIALEAIRTFVNGLLNNLPLIINAILELLGTIATSLIDNMSMITDTILVILNTLVGYILANLPVFMKAAIDILTYFANALIANIDTLLAVGLPLLEELVNGILANLPALLTVAITLITSLLNALLAHIPELLDAGLQILMALTDGIVANLPLLINAAITILQSIVDFIINNIDKLIDAAIEIVTTLADGILDALPVLVPAIIEIVTKIVDKICEPDTLSKLLDAAVEIILALADGLINSISQLLPAVINIIVRLVERLLQPDMIDKLIDAALQIILAIADGLIKALPELIAAIPRIIVAIVNAILRALPKIFNAGADLLQKFKQGIIDNIPNLIQAGVELVNGLWQGIHDTWGDFVQGVINLGNSFVDVVKWIFGIASPSKKFAEIGKFCVEGFDDAFDDFGDGALSSVQDTMDDISSLNFNDIGMGIENSSVLASGGEMVARGNYNNSVTINVYGAAGQDVNELADIVSRRINYETNKQKIAWGMA